MQPGFLSTSFSKIIALDFTFALWNDHESKTPVLLEIQLGNSLYYFGIENEKV